MATATNGNGNLVDEFEEAFQSCLSILTKEEALATMEKDEIKVEVDHCVLKFIDFARQMEAFFLQKRFLLSALKPELVVREDVNEMKSELARKEELLKRHHDKIAMWQNLLGDQGQGWLKNAAQGGPATPSGLNGAPPSGTPPQAAMMQQQLQQQQQQQIQQQMHMQQQMQQQMHQQQQVGPGMAAGMMMGPGVGMLHGPLAYLEKTTSNIGVGEGRR